MSQDQTANIFGFISTENNPNGLQKTAKFFNPSEKGSETSFLTQTTDRTDNTSSQTASEQQIIKGDIRRKPYNGKRVLSAHVNNRKKECELPQLMSPSLVTLKSAPPVEQIPPEYRQRPLLRNCISQESMRRRIDEPKEIVNFGGNMANMPENNFGGLPKRSAFFSNNGQNLVYVSDSELYAEKENCQENGDFIMNQGFRIRTHSNGGKVKIEKFNKIKVISAIPQADNLNGSLKASVLLKRGLSDKKLLKIDTKKSSLEIDLDEPKMALRQHPQSSHAISPNVFVFPNSATSKPRGISPVLLQNIEVIRSNTPSSASLRRAPLLLNKCDDHEPLKGLMDIRSPPVQDNDKLSMKRVQSERGKQICIGKNLEIGGAGSPIVRVGSHMSFKRSAFAAESSALSPTGPLDLRLKIQRGNSKFKNEEAVLNKLFNPVSLRKKE